MLLLERVPALFGCTVTSPVTHFVHKLRSVCHSRRMVQPRLSLFINNVQLSFPRHLSDDKILALFR